MSSNLEDKGYNGNPNIPISGHTHSYTKQEYDEYTKCMTDPIYFAENYFKIITADGDMVNLKLFEFQKEAIRAYMTTRKIILNTSRQIGKCVTYDTEIKIRNKKTGEIQNIKIGLLFDKLTELRKEITKYE